MAKARFLLHDRDTKFSEAFAAEFLAAGIEPLKLPPQSPNLNAFAERWGRSAHARRLARNYRVFPTRVGMVRLSTLTLRW